MKVPPGNWFVQVREIKYDPYQLVAVAQRLQRLGLPMVEFPQSLPNLTEASTNLYELIKGRNLEVYRDAEIRLSISRAVALETSRGWRIAKEKQAHKIDVVVALAQAALGATQRGQHPDPVFMQFFRMQVARRRIEEGWSVEAAAGAVNVPVDDLRESTRSRGNPMMDRYNQTLRRYSLLGMRTCAGCGATIGIGFTPTTSGGLDFCRSTPRSASTGREAAPQT